MLGIDHFAHQAVETNRLEAMALAVAIHEFILIAPQTRKFTQEEALALAPLARVGKRIGIRAASEANKPKPKPFKFNFKWDELLAIQSCITLPDNNPILQVFLGKIQQKAININVQTKTA